MSFHRSAPRALIADDDQVVLAMLQRILTKQGYEVATARDGEEAWVLATTVDFDVLLTDLEMPRTSGLELFNSIRDKKPNLPFIFVTGKPTLDSAVEVMNKGATAYIPKPFEPEQVLAALARAEKGARSLIQPPARQAHEAHEASETFGLALAGLYVHYQPVIRWSKKEAYSYEALMRTTHAQVPHPGVFLDLAETLGRVKDLGRQVRRRVADEVESRSDVPQLFFVNLHPDELLDDDLFNPQSALSRVAPRVYLEITERESLRGISDVMDRIRRLKSLGFGIAIDDIGAGYSGLNSFVDLEPDLVKIDMGLVRGIESCGRRKKLVGSLLDLAHDLDIDVVAEGIETEKERDTLVDLKCDLLQGYLFARPGDPFPNPVFAESGQA